MAEKKAASTTAKPRKPAAKKKAAPPNNVTEITVNREQVNREPVTVAREVTQEQIAELAHRLWNERGRQHGRAEEDWLRAEELLRGKAS